MNYKTILIAAVIALAAAGNAMAHCGTCGVGEPAAAAKGSAAEDTHLMGNKVCICGMKLSDEEGKSTHVDHEGKTYHFCSMDCADQFKKNPEEMIKKLSEESLKAEEAAKTEEAVKE